MNWLTRATAWLLPAGLRAGIAADLEDEANAGRHGVFWRLALTVRLALELRFRLGGDVLMATLKHALRSLTATPRFTVGAILTFALGIGLNLAVFAAVDRMLFRELPYADPHSLVFLRSCNSNTGNCSGSFPSAIAYALQQHSSTLRDLSVAGFSSRNYALSRDPNTDDRLTLTEVSPRTLRTLGVAPRMGRDLTDQEIEAHTRVAWVSEEVWRDRFGGDPAVLGRVLWAGSTPIPILGVLPRGFIPPTGGGTNPEWEGLTATYEGWSAIGPTGRVLVPFARLAPGASIDAAREEVAEAGRLQASVAPRPDGAIEHLQVDRIETGLFGLFRPYLWLVVAAAGLVLLMACANLVSLFLVRGRSREHLAAIATALGASRARLLATSLVESLAVCGAGAVVALGVLAASGRLLSASLPPIFSRYATGAFDPRVALVALVVACVCAVVAGLVPGWRLSRVDVLPVLQRSGRSGRRVRVSARGLLITEAALGTVLVLGAVLALRSFVALSRDSIGLVPNDLFVVSVSKLVRVPPDQQFANYQSAIEVLLDAPGVVAIGGADSMAVMGEGPPQWMSSDRRDGVRYQATAGYFETLRTPILAGRTFTADEVAARAPVAVLTRGGARLLWPQSNVGEVVGRAWRPAGESARTIVGVVDDLKAGYGATNTEPAVYVPASPESPLWRMFVVRMTPGVPLQVADVRRRLVERLGDMRASVTYLPTRLDPGLRDPRFRGVLLATLAVTGLLVAAIGLYSVASYDTALRRYEMGIRLTVGATSRDLRRLVFREVCAPVALGTVIGLGASWWLARFAEAFLYRTEGRDAVTYGIVAAVLLTTAVAAAWLPARRAGATDPALVLRMQ